MCKFLSKFIVTMLLVFCLGLTNCSYKDAYVAYATSQATMAANAGPLFKQKLTPDGKVDSFEVGNPMIPMAMLSMKPPKSEWESFTDMIKGLAPWAFGAWAIDGMKAVATSVSGHNTSVAGDSNLTGVQAGSSSPISSPVITTTETSISGGQ
jgi:hypothetical protein